MQNEQVTIQVPNNLALTIKDETPAFIRLSNGHYLLLVSMATDNSMNLVVFKESESEEIKFLPEIIIDTWSQEGAVDIRILSSFSNFSNDIDESIVRLNKYLEGYRIAKSTIQDIQNKISSGYFKCAMSGKSNG